jgi:hypothetical protein
MAKVLSLFGVVVALTLIVIFGLDLGMGDPKLGAGWPFMGFSKTMDIGFIVASVLLGYISLLTFREMP